LHQGPERKVKYNHDLHFYTKHPNTKLEKAIESLGCSPPQLDEELDIAAASIDAGDETTWRRRDEERRDGATEGPPSWHTGMEVEEAAIPTEPQRGVATLAKNNYGASLSPLRISARSSG
jgi:hypothetical protein